LALARTQNSYEAQAKGCLRLWQVFAGLNGLSGALHRSGHRNIKKHLNIPGLLGAGIPTKTTVSMGALSGSGASVAATSSICHSFAAGSLVLAICYHPLGSLTLLTIPVEVESSLSELVLSTCRIKWCGPSRHHRVDHAGAGRSSASQSCPFVGMARTPFSST